MNAIELKRLGDHYEELGDYESAELLFRSALKVQEREVGEEHASLAIDLYNLGLLCYSLEKYNDAETFLMRAWAIERRCFGPMHPNTLASLEALSDLYHDSNRNTAMEYKTLAATAARTHHQAVHFYH